MTEELFEEICERLERGETLTKILLDSGMPTYNKVLAFRRQKPERETRYKLAREEQMHRWSDDIVDLADCYEDKDSINKTKMKITTRQWLMERVCWRVYGAKGQTEISGANGGPIVMGVDAPPEETRDQWLARKALELAQVKGLPPA
jgi:hypothetical protein